jgi:hypothetical protein
MMRELDSLDLSENPTTDSIRTLIGADLLSRLSMDMGGLAVSIPHKPGKHSPIAECIGLDAAQKISHVYGGMVFKIPVRPGIEAEILQLLDDGWNKNQIARKMRINRSRIDKLLERKARENQMSLFSE